MQLLIHELVHLTISLVIFFLIWKQYKKLLPALIGALAGGFFIDSDHLFDYFLTFGLNFNLYYFLNSYQFDISKKIYVPFHAWEYLIILTYFILNLQNKLKKRKSAAIYFLLSFLVSLTLGIYSHLIIDTIDNHVRPLGYSLIYRVVNNFDRDKISAD